MVISKRENSFIRRKKLRNDTKWGIDFTCRKINNEDIKEKNEKLEKPLSRTLKNKL